MGSTISSTQASVEGSDTIVALSSGSVPSGIAVVRLSGPATQNLLRAHAGLLPRPRKLVYSDITADGKLIDRGLVVFFPAPHSFTGEDCAEFQLHGSPAVVRAALRALTAHPGVRLAEAGEFTRRAFENGRLDLTEIEGLGDLILAETETQRTQALARMGGGLSTQLDSWRSTMLDLRAEIEARLDFSDEGDVSDSLPETWLDQLLDLKAEIDHARESVARGRVTREGLRVALAGPPNAGKSSLLNALARSDVAIVTHEPGTTRDVREVAADLGGRLVILIDMAGLRETDSLAESEGVRRARAELQRADLVLWLHAPDVPDLAEPLPEGTPVWRIATKLDLAAAPAGAAPADLALSAATGAGLDQLTQRLAGFAENRTGGDPVLLSRERDAAALGTASAELDRALGTLDRPELAADSLRAAGDALARLLGRMDAEQVLDRLFSSFCIGK